MARDTVIVGDRRRQDLFGVPGIPNMPAADRRRPQSRVYWFTWHSALAAGVVLLVWTALILTTPSARFAVYTPTAQVGVESASTLARLFGALVLFLFPSVRSGPRLGWVATGLLILGLGSLIFGDIQPIAGIQPNFNSLIYESLLMRIVAGGIFAVGLALPSPPRLSARAVSAITAAYVALAALIGVTAGQLPRLVTVARLSASDVQTGSILRGLTAWHWSLSLVALALSLLAVWGTVQRLRGNPLGAWMLLAMVLLAASQLHSLFWPSTFSRVLTTADLLRLGFAAVVTAGGILELRRTAARRATLLVAEQEQSKRLAELNVLKASFTAMVVHEIGSPLATIDAYLHILRMPHLSAREREQALSMIEHEKEALARLVTDIQQAARVEMDDFKVALRPVRLQQILLEASTYGRTLSGAHALVTPIASQEIVWADPDRVGQVLRNLLGNAAKYSMPGAPIQLCTSRLDSRVRIEVKDRGFGIKPEDLSRIFEKFQRGLDNDGNRIPGVGLGLYLSRRIVEAHGSQLTVDSVPGMGSTFGFDLEVVV